MANLEWYVLYTKPHCERQVERGLIADGIETYYPVLPAPKPRRGHPPVRPFFPCYLFAHLDIDAVGVSRLNWTPGMRHLVMFGGVPATVDERVIARIREHLDEEHAMDIRGEILAPGDHVIIESGPLRDIEAIFDERLSASGRVRVFVEFLRRWKPVDVGADTLRKTSPRRSPFRR